VGLAQGSVSYPTTVDPACVDRVASDLRTVASKLGDVGSRLSSVGDLAGQSWTGEAALTFVNHMDDRALSFGLVVEHVREAAAALDGLAVDLRRSLDAYRRYATNEQMSRETSPPNQERILTAIADQQSVVRDLEPIGARFRAALADTVYVLDMYARDGFIAIGERILVPCMESSTGRNLIADALDATENKSIAVDQIQVQKLSDGSYVLVLPGVMDMSNLGFLRGDDINSVRTIGNAAGTATRDGMPNNYAEMVKMAMRRAGIPSGSEVTIVGHSYGSYTAMDLAGNDAFNSADGTGEGYNVRVRRVVGVGADTDWKMKRVPAQTDVVVLNSRDDSVYQAEAQLDPELDWLVRTDRVLVPKPGSPPSIPSLQPSPFLAPVTTYPTGRRNQIEVEVNAGKGGDWNDKMSGHFPGRLSPVVRSSADQPMGRLLDDMGDLTVVERFNLRVPDSVPKVPSGR
jgi:pimeloyl-ACP methyl ester carboxylesterase